jgi:PKD repeat protein
MGERNAYSLLVVTLLACLAVAPVAVADDVGSMALGTTTESKPQNKFWHNGGKWYGILLDTSDHFIHRFENGQWVKQASGLVHTQNGAKVDTLWNGSRLLVLVGTTPTSQYMEFTYDAATRTYAAVSGFPVNLTLGDGSLWANLEQDSTGKVWVVTRVGTAIRVFCTTSADRRTWSSGFTLGTVGEDECAALAAFAGKVGAFWSDQDSDAFYFRYHTDGESDTSWSSRETVEEGGGIADDHINLAVTPGNVILAATKDGSDNMNLFVRHPSTGWSGPFEIGSIATRPSVVYDETGAICHFLYTDWRVSTDKILHKEIPFSEVEDIATEPSEVFLSASYSLNNVTSTRQCVTNATGLLAGADGNGNLHYRLRTINSAGMPQVEISASPLQGRVPLTVDFSSTASDPDGTIASYAWTFGDGGTSTSPNPSHVYETAGPRTARLVVTDNDGNTAEDAIDILATSADTPLPGTVIARINFQPSNMTVPSGYIADLGSAYAAARGFGWDGSVPVERRNVNPDLRLDSYAYVENSDTATWKYDISNGQYFVDVVCGSPAWSGLHKVVLEGTTVFNGEATGEGEFVTATDQLVTVFDGNLTVVCGGAAGGSKKTKICYLIIRAGDTGGGGGNSPPTADAQASVTTGTAPLDVSFTGVGTDSDGSIESWSWTFGDGGTSSAQNPTHTYSTAGNFTARLQVTDDQGGTASDTIAISVDAGAGSPPTVDARASVTSGMAPLPVAFTGVASDPDGSIASWSWTFGDGGSSTLQNPSRTYTVAGDYTVRLEVADNQGNTASDTVVISVAAPPDAPTGDVADAIAALEPGQWYEIPDSWLDAVKPNPVPRGSHANVIAAWSGGAYDTKRDRLIVWGGGHGDYSGNEIYAFSMRTFQWERLTDPSTWPGSNKNPNRLVQHPDGRPVSRHTYDYLEYIPPPVDRFFCGGGGALWYDSFSDPNTYLFDFDRVEWEKKAATPCYGTGSLSAIGPDGLVWQQGVSDSRSSLASFDAARNVWTNYVTFNGWLGTKKTAAIDPARMKFVAIGGGDGRVWDLRNPSQKPAALNATGATAIMSASNPGLEYDAVSGRLVAWSGGALVYSLDLDTNVWTSRTTSGVGTTPPAATATGTYGRWRYVPSLNVFVVVNDTQKNVFVYRHAE